MKFCELTNSNKFNKGMENLMRFVKIEKKDPIPNHIKENLEKLEIATNTIISLQSISFTQELQRLDTMSSQEVLKMLGGMGKNLPSN
jgi:hypothetical protein